MAMQIATFICMSFLCQVAYAGMYEDISMDLQFASRYLSADNDSNTTLSGPSPTPAPKTPRPTPPPTTPPPTPPALVQEITVAITDVDSTPSTLDIEAAAQEACTGTCSVEVVEEFKVSLTFTFGSYPCTGVSTLNVITSIATTLSVDFTQVTADVTVTGCRRFLQNGERRLQTGSATVASETTYPASATGKTAATSAMGMETNTIASSMATALSAESGVTIAPPTVDAPTLAVEQTVVTTPPAGGEVPAPLTDAEIGAALPGADFTAETLSTTAPTPPPTVESSSVVGTLTTCPSLCGDGYSTASATTFYTKADVSTMYPYIEGDGNATCSDIETIITTNGTYLDGGNCDDLYAAISTNDSGSIDTWGAACCTLDGVASSAFTKLQPMFMTLAVMFACAAMTTRE